jgi:hypothetical protein
MMHVDNSAAAVADTRLVLTALKAVNCYKTMCFAALQERPIQQKKTGDFWRGTDQTLLWVLKTTVYT